MHSRGTEITRQVLKETTAQMHVKHTDEQGHLDIAVENENIKVTYAVERVHKEISKGVMGAIAGAVWGESSAIFSGRTRVLAMQ